MSVQYSLDDIKGSMNQINQSILNGTTFPNLSEWLKYLHGAYTNNNIILLAKVFPKLETISDLIQLNEYLKSQIASQNYTELARSFKMARDQTVLYDNKQIRPCINITVKRKSPPLFCFGKECFKKAKRYVIGDLFSIKCCKFHNYCKSCIQNHIKNSLIKDPYKKVRCEACIEIGTVNYDDPTSIITESEIEHLIPQAERTMYYQEEARKRFLTKCQSGLSYCPNRQNFLQKKDIIELPCGDNPCKDCYALSIIEFIDEVVTIIVNKPENFLNYPLVGIMCHNRHATTLRRCSGDELNEILSVGSVDDRKRVATVEKYNQYYNFFMGYPVEFCKSCFHIDIQNEKFNIVCKNCFRCLICFKRQHPGISCEDFQKLDSDYGQIHDKKTRSADPSDPDRNIMGKVGELLKNSEVSNHRLAFYKKIEVKAIKKYLNQELVKKCKSVKSSYIYSDPVAKEGDIDNFYYEGFKKLDSINFFELNLKLKNLPDEFWVMIYRVSFDGEAIQRKPNENDGSEEAKLYVSGNKCYFNKDEMALPYLIVMLEKLK